MYRFVRFLCRPYLTVSQMSPPANPNHDARLHVRYVANGDGPGSGGDRNGLFQQHQLVIVVMVVEPGEVPHGVGEVGTDGVRLRLAAMCRSNIHQIFLFSVKYNFVEFLKEIKINR